MANLDDLLRQALLEAADRDLAQVDVEEPPFSEDYLRWEQKFLQDPQGVSRKKLRPLWSKALRTAACLLLVSSLSFGAVMVGSPQARAWVVQWIAVWYDTHVSYRFEGEAIPTEALRDWEPTYLPEGYEQTDYIDLENMVNIIYNTDDPDMEIIFSYLLLSGGNGEGLDNERHVVSSVSIDGMPGHFYAATDGSHNMLVWIDERNHTSFLLMARLPCETLIEIAESIILVK